MCDFGGTQRLLPRGFVMDDLRCPNLDLLGFRLIEAYRHLGDVKPDPGSSPEQAESQLEMSLIEQEIRDHPQNCSICRAINWKKEVIRAFSKNEPAWRGTMAS